MSGDEVTRIPAGLPGGGPRQAMSLPHNIRPDQMVGPDTSGTRWKRFQPLKKLQRMFRRKSKTKDDGEFPDPKSFSAGQLPPADLRRPSRRDSQPLQSRLSVSHDSIFQSESGGGSGAQAGAQMGSALSIPSVPGASGQLAAELRGVLLKRRADDSDEDDPGLPHSPSSPSTPPATSRHHQTELKGQSGKSGGSCSDGSLLSMYSSGTCTDDDIFGPLSKHPSRASLGRDADGLELETGAALSHSAAKHRIAVRPRRTHGAPRPRRARARPSTAGPAATGLPPTVEEESPPATPTTRTAAPARAEGSSPARRLSPERPRRAPSVSPSRSQSTRIGSPEPAVAAASPVSIRPTQVKRSKSSVADGRIRDVSPRKFWARDTPSPATAAASSAAATPATDEDRRADRGETFFSRIFGSRRSGRKKKDDRSLSPETAESEQSQTSTPTPAPMSAPVVAPSRRPPMPRHRDRSQFGSSPASAMHADIIRLPPSEANRAAELVEPPRRVTEMPRGADVPRSVDLLRAAEPAQRPASEVPRPPADALRRGPAFLADVRAEVAALAAGGDRGDRGDLESSAVSPQVLRRQRAAAAAASNVRPTDSPRARPRLVGLTAYQQRVAHMQRSPSPEPVTGPAARRSFSCENVGEPEAGSGRGSGMALDRVLGFIKSTSAAQAAAAERQPARQQQSSEEQESAMPVPARSAGSPGAGPKSLDSSLLSAAAEPPPAPPPNKASSAESVQSGGQERMTRSAGDQQVPEFLRVQLNRVESHNRDSALAAESRSESRPAERRDSGRDSGRDSAERRSSGRDSTEPEFAASSNASDDSPPQLRRPSAARSGSPPDLRRRPSQARSRGSASSGDAEPVVLRNKPTPSSEDSELLKVFKRRSLKSRDPEDLASALVVTTEQDRPGAQRTSRSGVGDEKENEQPREQSEETVVSVCVSVPASRPVTIAAPPAAEETSETPRRGAAVTRRESEAVRRPSGQEEEAGRPAGWLKQAVRERRERREQLEQKQLRTPATTTKELIIESEPGRAAGGASRSSRVLEMANTFQKLQTT